MVVLNASFMKDSACWKRDAAPPFQRNALLCARIEYGLEKAFGRSVILWIEKHNSNSWG